MTKITDPDPPALLRSLSLLPEPLSSPDKTQHATDDLPCREQPATYLRDHREKGIIWPTVLTHRRKVLSKRRKTCGIYQLCIYLPQNPCLKRNSERCPKNNLQVQIQAGAHKHFLLRIEQPKGMDRCPFGKCPEAQPAKMCDSSLPGGSFVKQPQHLIISLPLECAK
jgi:hypothetical protein